MRINYYPMIAVALMMSVATMSKADKVIRILSNDTEAAPVEITVKSISKIEFASSSFSVLHSENDAGTTFDLKNVSKISFEESTSVESVKEASAMVVTPNPVQSNLIIKGGEDLFGNEMNLYSATGMLVMQVPSWNGEAIDVAHLPAGIYFINIQSETIKFVKL